MFVALGFSQVTYAENDSYCNSCTEIACSPCDPCEQGIFCDPCNPVCKPKKSKWFIGGHGEAGFFANEYGNKDQHYNGWTDPGNLAYFPGTLHNVRNTGGQLNQLVFFMGREADGRRGWDWGGRVDYMFGTDAALAQSRGLEYASGHWDNADPNHWGGRWGSGDYYSALTQAYFEGSYKKMNIKVGKFLTPMGHESLYSTDRFFYSLSDAFCMLPITQSGALLTYDVNKKLSVFGGWVQGQRASSYDSYYDPYWDEMVYEDNFFDSSHNNAFLFGLKYDFSKRGYVKYSAMIGRDTSDSSLNLYYGGLRNDRNYFVQSLVVGYKPGKRWDYTFEWTLKNDKNDNPDGHWYTDDDHYGTNSTKYYWGAYGINQELIYRINKKWSVGLRAEWSYNYASTHGRYDEIHGGNDISGSWRDSNGCDKYGFALTANWTPRSWLTVRPELRYDKFDGAGDYANYQFTEKGTAGRNRDKQLSGGVSAIVKF